MSEKMIRAKMIKSDIKIPEQLTGEVIDKLVSNHKTYLPRFRKLQDYYEGDTDILKRVKKDLDKPNNKITSGHYSYIIDLMQGMFVGKPISYTSVNEDYMKEIQKIFNNNDEQDENSELAKMAGIKGKAYEIVYIDEDGKINFNEINAEEMIIVYNTSIKPKMKLALRLYNNEDIVNGLNKSYVDAYTYSEIITYELRGQGYTETNRIDHYYGQVPVIEYLNNDECIGDFERVMSIIQAYEKSNSDSANDFEEFTDAFLVLTGMMGTDPEDIKKLREDRVLLTDGEKQGAYWLIKEINDAALENHKNRLNDDIHKFAKIPDMSDDNFSGNASGVALEHKLLALEQVLSSKERKFKRALQKRIELITTILNKFDKGYIYTDIDISFTRNKPINIKEAVEIAAMLRGFTSMSTALSELPMVDNVTLEQEKIDMEKEVYRDENIDLDNLEDDLPKPNRLLDLISRLPERDRDLAKDILRDMKSKKEVD